MTYHIYPTDDLRDHHLEGESCWCHPEVEYEEDGKIIIHKSMDRREEYEEGRKMS